MIIDFSVDVGSVTNAFTVMLSHIKLLSTYLLST